ncbi:MAG: transposase, partial [Solirubrobacterales bacterium]|nr:transposase [Solirubrobacterales bacterium]
MKEAYAVRRTVPPSAEIQANIDKLLGSGLVEDPQKMLSELARLGARLIIQRAVEDEFDEWLGRCRYERSRPEYQRGLRNGFRPRRVQTAEGELEVEIPQVREAAEPFVSKLFGRWHYKRLLQTEPLKALIVGAFVRGLSMRDVESLCDEAGLGKTSKSTVARICSELHERFEAFCRRDLYEIRLVVLFLDAIYLPVRPSGPKEGVMCAWGFTETGERALVAVRLGAREAKEDWLELGRDLITRGLAAPRLIVADGAPGLTLAIEEVWPRADRQHCAVHRLRNLQAKLPKTEHDRVRLAYWKALNEATGVKDGKLRLQVLINDLRHGGYESGARLPGRRPRRPGRGPALPPTTPQPMAKHKSARTLTRRGPPAHQGDRPIPRRDQLPNARLGRARPVLQPRQQRRHLHR